VREKKQGESLECCHGYLNEIDVIVVCRLNMPIESERRGDLYSLLDVTRHASK